MIPHPFNMCGVDEVYKAATYNELPESWWRWHFAGQLAKEAMVKVAWEFPDKNGMKGIEHEPQYDRVARVAVKQADALIAKLKEGNGEY